MSENVSAIKVWTLYLDRTISYVRIQNSIKRWYVLDDRIKEFSVNIIRASRMKSSGCLRIFLKKNLIVLA